MTNLSTVVLLGLSSLGLSTPALASDAPASADQEGVVFRKDVFVRHADGYHTYRIPVMVATSKGTLLLLQRLIKGYVLRLLQAIRLLFLLLIWDYMIFGGRWPMVFFCSRIYHLK